MGALEEGITGFFAPAIASTVGVPVLTDSEIVVDTSERQHAIAESVVLRHGLAVDGIVLNQLGGGLGLP